MNNTETLSATNFQLPGQVGLYHGKVRDVYDLGKHIVMIATDRISAFDVVLPQGIPYKGQILNQIAAMFLDATTDIVPNWKISVPDPMVTIGHKAKPFALEMIVRGYIAGSAWREYKAGARQICGVALPEGLKENQRLPQPIITPTTKEDTGHDQNITADEILKRGLATPEQWNELCRISLALFNRGQETVAKRGLILVDTKYEFGLAEDGSIMLIDEIHTPDSSRYFYAEGYEQRLASDQPQRQLSKEFVRQWLLDNNFSGQPGQTVPEMTPEICNNISMRYQELFTNITGNEFAPGDTANLQQRILNNILNNLP